MNTGGWLVCVRVCDGPNLVSPEVQNWSQDRPANLHIIDQGSPWQNGYNESF